MRRSRPPTVENQASNDSAQSLYPLLRMTCFDLADRTGGEILPPVSDQMRLLLGRFYTFLLSLIYSAAYRGNGNRN